VSDAGVGALCIRTAVLGAAMNVKINAQSILNREGVNEILNQVQEMEKLIEEKEKTIRQIVNQRMSGN
jgi:glutamate formiminotransferase/formiminotetrahydrofolate cyclodeaminase